MRRFATWAVDAKSGRQELFKVRQTPEKIADDTARELTYPTFLTEGSYFALGVWELPEGKDIRQVPDDDPSRGYYMQAAGSNRALTIEARVPAPDGGYTHYVLAREAVVDPDRWVPLSWDNGSAEPYTIRLHPEEVFTGEQAVPVFRDYIINARLPEPRLLRVIDV